MSTVEPKSRMMLIWRSVLPLEMGMMAQPIFSSPPCRPNAPVKRVYPKLTCAMSFSVAPPAVAMRAMHSAHVSRSRRVYPAGMGWPVVARVAWMRSSCRLGSASYFLGFCSRSSVLVVRGILAMSLSVRMSEGLTPALTILS